VGAFRRTSPRQKVAIHANTCTPLGIATRKLAAEVTVIARSATPAANMWWIQSAKLTSPTPASAATIAR
jgi:hypothetical protein